MDCSGGVYQQAENPEAEGGEHGEGDGEVKLKIGRKNTIRTINTTLQNTNPNTDSS